MTTSGTALLHAETLAPYLKPKLLYCWTDALRHVSEVILGIVQAELGNSGHFNIFRRCRTPSEDDGAERDAHRFFPTAVQHYPPPGHFCLTIQEHGGGAFPDVGAVRKDAEAARISMGDGLPLLADEKPA